MADRDVQPGQSVPITVAAGADNKISRRRVQGASHSRWEGRDRRKWTLCVPLGPRGRGGRLRGAVTGVGTGVWGGGGQGPCCKLTCARGLSQVVVATSVVQIGMYVCICFHDA